MSRDVLYIESAEQAAVLLKPRRVELLRAMTEPKSCPELGELFGETPQKIYYHVKAMERAGLVERTGERRIRGILEGFYQAQARSYWLAPTLVKRLGGTAAVRDRASLAVLAGHAEQMLHDVGRLIGRSSQGTDTPSLSLAAEIHLPDADRRAGFMRDLERTVQDLARRYSTAEGERPTRARGHTFRLTIGCYPRPEAEAA
jgi:hypothetical protein